MKWSEKCMLELTHHNLFEDDAHRCRFRDLLDCYCHAPFFTAGLCKCMFLSSFDEEHFTMILDILNELTIERVHSLELMKDQGQVAQARAEKEAQHSPDSSAAAEYEFWKVANSFLSGRPYPQDGMRELEISEPDAAYVIKRTIEAARRIDELPAPGSAD